MNALRPKTRCMLIFGTRPEVIKLAPIALAMRAQPELFDVLLVSTGQHRELGRQALAMFNLTADIDLDLMAQDQTVSEFFGRAVTGLDRVMVDWQPDWVLVQGDTGSVLAGAIAAYYRKVRVAHVEAGLRTYDLMAPHPEEGNRQMVSRITSLHFPPTERARQVLLKEDIAADKILVTGNTVVDAVQWIHQHSDDETQKTLHTLLGGKPSRLVLTTIHRRESFGEPLMGMLESIRSLAEDTQLGLTFLIPVHPNPHVTKAVHTVLGGRANIKLVPPVDYKTMLAAMAQSWMVLTDSGGLQEEAPSFSVPVLVLRNLTERPEGIEAGVAQLVGTDKAKIIAAVTHLAHHEADYQKMRHGVNPYGNGRAAHLISDRLLKEPKVTHA